jgi:hypothetical protein
MANVGPSAFYLNSVAYTAIAQWASGAKVAGQLCRQLTAPAIGSERVYVCLVAGSSTVEPTWLTTKGSITTSNSTDTWQECTGQPGVNGDIPISLTTNASSPNTTNILYLGSTTGVQIGQMVSGANIPPAAIVLGFTSSTVTLSLNTTGIVASGATIWFGNCPVSAAQRSAALTLGLIIFDPVTSSLQTVSIAGTAGAASPSFSATAGVTTTDSGVTWTSLGLASNFGSWVASAARASNVVATNWIAGNGTLYVSDNHSETAAAAISLTFPGTYTLGMNRALCIDHTVSLPAGAANLKTTALLTTTGAFGIILAGGFYMYGFILAAGTGAVNNSVQIGSINNDCFLENCQIQKNGTTGASAVFVSGWPVTFINTTVQFGSTGDSIFIGNGALLRWKNTPNAIAGAIFPTNLFTFNASAGQTLELDGVDLSAVTGVIIRAATAINLTMTRCKINASATLNGGSPVGWPPQDVIFCDSSGSTAQQQRSTVVANLITSTLVYRSNSAQPYNGVVSSSWNIAVLQYGTIWRPFESFELAEWNTVLNTNRVVTIYGLFNAPAVPGNDQAFIEVAYLGSSSSPQASYASSGKANIMSQASPCMADSVSQWSAAARVANTAYAVGNAVTVAANPGRVFFCTTAGTSFNGAEPSWMDTAVDGQTGVADGSTLIWRAGCRFSMVVTLSAPHPQLVGDITATVKIGSLIAGTIFVDPLINLS